MYVNVHVFFQRALNTWTNNAAVGFLPTISYQTIIDSHVGIVYISGVINVCSSVCTASKTAVCFAKIYDVKPNF